MNSPASELSTTSTPRPPVAARIVARRSRASASRITCGTPSARRSARLSGAAGRREDLRADALRELHRRQADAAGGRVDQHALAGAQAGELLQPVARR